MREMIRNWHIYTSQLLVICITFGRTLKLSRFFKPAFGIFFFIRTSTSWLWSWRAWSITTPCKLFPVFVFVPFLATRSFFPFLLFALTTRLASSLTFYFILLFVTRTRTTTRRCAMWRITFRSFTFSFSFSLSWSTATPVLFFFYTLASRSLSLLVSFATSRSSTSIFTSGSGARPPLAPKKFSLFYSLSSKVFFNQLCKTLTFWSKTIIVKAYRESRKVI